MAAIRAFIALPMSEETRTKIEAIQQELKMSSSDVKWEAPYKFHITLKFLGKTELQLIQNLADDLTNRFQTFSPFDLKYQSLGCFPSVTRPRIVWISTAPNETLLRIAAETEEACLSYGFAKEARPYHAHITLGRVKTIRDLLPLTEKVKSVTFEPFQARCSAVHIMHSDLHPSGSTYFLVKSIPLQS